MLNHSIFVLLILMVTSCGQNSSSAIVRSDSKDQEIYPIKADTTVPTGPKLKHEAYNQDIKMLPASIADFIPNGYTALDTTAGDLNLDQYPDRIIILKKNGEDTSSNVVEHPEKRPLLILIGQPDKTYKLAARNDNAVLCVDCGGMMGDPFLEVVIKKGYFSIEYFGGSNWRWSRTVTFKYSPAYNYWYLHKDGGSYFHTSNPNKATTNIRTVKDFGKVPFDKFDIYKDQ